MIVRGPEFWGLDLIVSMGGAYAVVLALALALAIIRRASRQIPVSSVGHATAQRGSGNGAGG